MSQGYLMLSCFIENDTSPFLVTAPVGIMIDHLKKLIREEGIDVLAKDLTLWKPRVPIPLEPPLSLAQRIKNLGPDFSTFASNLEPFDLVTEVFQEQTPITYLDVIVQLPASDKWQDMNSHHYSADIIFSLSFPTLLYYQLIFI
ncbi:hypothetical protein BJV78DRAFT_1174803 [Lactifluus subvellereus]|nr:hypothetical protein BJV78DRAFT_1174803 [Lactifluus subvellereus]